MTPKIRKLKNQLKRVEAQLRQALKSDGSIRVYVADLAAYNAGKLRGEWVELPSYGELDEVIDRMGHDGASDVAIHDYEAPFKIDEFDNLLALDEALEDVVERGLDLEILGCIKDYAYPDLVDAARAAEDAMVAEAKDEEDLAYQFVDDVYGGVDNMEPNEVEMYFDYEKFGRDASTELYDEADQEVYDQFVNDQEYGEYLVDELGLPANPGLYFDYEKFGRDLALDYFQCGDYFIRID